MRLYFAIVGMLVTDSAMSRTALLRVVSRAGGVHAATVTCRHVHRLSSFLLPLLANKLKASTAKSNDEATMSEYLQSAGFVRRSTATGLVHVLPLGQRVMDKATRLIERHMSCLGAHKMALASLSPRSLWSASGRLDLMGSEMFKMTDRNGKVLCLNPTHEEVVCQLVASMSPVSLRQLPLMLYQFSSKFRDEIRPIHGLIRSREFLMKDMYSFDESLKKARATYTRVVDSYSELFKKLGIDVVKVRGDCGVMGGSLSHEFHVITPTGDDRLLVCTSCNNAGGGGGTNCDTAVNEAVLPSGEATANCGVCGGLMTQCRGIEVGHTFMLGEHYSRTFGAYCTPAPPSAGTTLSPPPPKTTASDSTRHPLFMCSYGVGVGRLVAAAVSSRSERLNGGGGGGAADLSVSWPLPLAPFRAYVVPAKAGSREEPVCDSLLPQLLHELQDIPALADDVIVDDRCQLTIGQRVKTAAAVGVPYIVVVGHGAGQTPPQLELITSGGNQVAAKSMMFCQSELLRYLREQLQSVQPH